MSGPVTVPVEFEDREQAREFARHLILDASGYGGIAGQILASPDVRERRPGDAYLIPGATDDGDFDDVAFDNAGRAVPDILSLPAELVADVPPGLSVPTGWCAPKDQAYNFLPELPEVTAKRGGIDFANPPEFRRKPLDDRTAELVEWITEGWLPPRELADGVVSLLARELAERS